MEWYNSLNFNEKFAVYKNYDKTRVFTSRKSKEKGTKIREWVLEKRGFHFAEDLYTTKRDNSGKSLLAKQFLFARTLECMYDFIYNFYEESDRHIYEVISDKVNPIKLFFDFDFKCVNEAASIKKYKNIIDDATVALLAFIKQYLLSKHKYTGVFDAFIMYSDGKSSKDKYKISRHIIINGPVFNSNIIYMKNFINTHVVPFMKTITDLEFLDNRVYSPWRNFRLVDNSKFSKDNTSTIIRYNDSIVDFETWKKLLINVYDEINPIDIIKLDDVQISFDNAKISTRSIITQRKTESLITQETNEFDELRKWVITEVLSIIGETTNVWVSTPVRNGNNITIKCERNSACTQCYVATCMDSKGSHESNGFAINIHLLPNTVHMFCFGTDGHKNNTAQEIRLHVCVPSDILKKFKIWIPDEPPLKLNVTEDIFLRKNCEKIGFEFKSGVTYYYYNRKKERPFKFCCENGRIEVMKKNDADHSASMRCLNFNCSVIHKFNK